MFASLSYNVIPVLKWCDVFVVRFNGYVDHVIGLISYQIQGNNNKGTLTLRTTL